MKKLMVFISLLFIALIGNAFGMPGIQVSENSHHFGFVRAGAYSRWFICIQNTGNEPLIIFSIDTPDKHFVIQSDINYPLHIQPADTLMIALCFHPDKAEYYESQLLFATNDPDQETFTIAVSGEGKLNGLEMGILFWEYQLNNPGDREIKAIINTDDINGDGINDLVFASGDGFITCLNPNSSGQADSVWAVQIPDGTLNGQNCISLVIDIDSDNYNDIILGTAGEDRSIIALSGKTGTQIWKTETSDYGLGGPIHGIDFSFDYNNDGFTDILAAAGDDKNQTGPKRVYCLDVFTGESIWEKPLMGPAFAVIGVDDFTGDGMADAIAGTTNPEETEGAAIAVNGANGQQTWQTIMPGKAVTALIQVDDTENSGHKNVMIGDASGEYRIIDPVTLYFIDVGGIGISPIHRFAELDDVNSDNHPDVLVSSNLSKAIVLNGAGGAFLSETPLNGSAFSIARISDISGDGINDFLVGTKGNEGFAYFINGTHGNILFDTNFIKPVTSINSIADINGDGSMEIIVGTASGKLACLSGGPDAEVGTEEILPFDYKKVHGVYPNPFENQTTIWFELPESGFTEVTVYTLTGKKISLLCKQFLSKGRHELIWRSPENNKIEKGIYFYNIMATGFVTTGKIIKL